MYHRRPFVTTVAIFLTLIEMCRNSSSNLFAVVVLVTAALCTSSLPSQYIRLFTNRTLPDTSKIAITRRISGGVASRSTWRKYCLFKWWVQSVQYAKNSSNCDVAVDRCLTSQWYLMDCQADWDRSLPIAVVVVQFSMDVIVLVAVLRQCCSSWLLNQSSWSVLPADTWPFVSQQEGLPRFCACACAWAGGWQAAIVWIFWSVDLWSGICCYHWS